MNPQDAASQSVSELKLSHLLTRQTIQLRASVRDWEEAASLAGGLLVQAGCVEPAYIAAMKAVLREMGPYAVIAPGIVLLHARPAGGVRQPCLSLVTLATPVEFGHSQNDPVDVVFALGVVDKRAHIKALQQLATLLGDEAALAKLRSAATVETVLAVIHEWEA
jgi:PTS system ascorbate-specific IIA component